MKYILSVLALLSVPAFVFAQTNTVSSSITKFISFLNDYLVPLIFALAFIVFLWGIVKYFFIGGGNDESRSEGRQFIMYGIIGFVIMLSLWGIVALISNSLGIDKNTRPCLPTFGGKCNPVGGSGSANSDTQYFDQGIDGFTNQP